MELPVIDNVAAPDSGQHNFHATLHVHGLQLPPVSVGTLQVNVGKLCNQACLHCHVDASPTRTETMDERTAEQVLAVLTDHPQIHTLDITGGAPELNPNFTRLVTRARELNRHVMVRHNLTVMLEGNPVTGQSMEHLPEFFAEHRCEVVCSLPYYSGYFTDKQRGRGVFDKSVQALRRLNAVGYGMPDTGLILNVVYNPAGAFLPASQQSLEADYRRELRARFGLEFNNLYTITNMPIHRFAQDLLRHGGYAEYMMKLVNAFNPQAAAGVMCRTLVSVNYDGRLSDCDFNQMLDMPLQNGTPQTIFDWDAHRVLNRQIVFARHCYGCTAGAGSSCGGATTT